MILLQAGRGGGLTEMFGGGEMAQSVLGTQAPVILKKATTVSAIVFLVTSLLLGMVTARRGRSLFAGARFPAAPVASQQETSPVAQPVSLPSEEAVPAAEPTSQTEGSGPASESQ
jgi:preprotein translocase subunit SecG